MSDTKVVRYKTDLTGFILSLEFISLSFLVCYAFLAKIMFLIPCEKMRFKAKHTIFSQNQIKGLSTENKVKPQHGTLYCINICIN